MRLKAWRAIPLLLLFFPWTVVQADTVAPTIPSSVLPQSGISTNTGHVLFKWTKSSDAESGVLGYRVILSSNNWVSTQRSMFVADSSGTNWLALPALGNGNWKWKVLALDNAGNRSAWCAERTLQVTAVTRKVFILGGQSNMVGHGIWNTLVTNAYKNVPSNVTYYYIGSSSPRAFSTSFYFGPEIRFSHTLAAAKPTENIIIIKYAVSGTAMDYWRVENTNYAKLISFVTNITRTLGGTISYEAFLWMQGESDCYNGALATPYEQRTRSFISNARKDLRKTDLPFLFGLADPPPGAGFKTIVQKAQSNISGLVANAELVSTMNLSRKSNDLIHYNTDGQMALGYRFAQSYLGFVPDQVEQVPPIVTSGKSSFSTNAPFFLVLSVDKDWGYWSTNGPNGPYQQFSAPSTSVHIARTTIVHFFGRDSLNNTSQTQSRLYQFDFLPPGNPVLLSPSAGSVTNSSAFLVWTKPADASGISGYEIRVDGSAFFSDFSNILISGLASGTHVWRVRAKDHAGNWGAFSASNTFISDVESPGIPNALYPAMQMTNRNSSQLFRWSESIDLGPSGLSGYKLVVSGVTTFVSVRSQVRFLSEGLHSWQVSAVDREGNTSSPSVARTLFVDSLPPLVLAQSSPLNNSVSTQNNQTLVWRKGIDSGSGIKGYNIQYAVNPTFSSPVTINSVTTQVSVFFTKPSTNWWRVRAFDKAGNTNAWSDVWKVMVVSEIPDLESPSQPIDLYPIGTSFTSRSPVFSWKKSLDNKMVSHYEVVLDGFSFQTYSTSWVPSQPLEIGVHTWSVRSVDSSGNKSVWSSETVFEIIVQAPDLDLNSYLIADGNPLDLRTGENRMLFVFNSKDPEKTELTIFTLAGREVVRLKDEDNDYRMSWDGKDRNGIPVPLGIYLVVMKTGNKVRGERPLRIGVLR